MKRREFLRIVAAVLLGKAFEPCAFGASPPLENGQEHMDNHVRDYLYKMRHFDEPASDDIYLEQPLLHVMESCVARLERLQGVVGYGQFHLISLDEGCKVSRDYSKVGSFPKEELDFLEKIFYANASGYGFFGNKPLTDFTSRIPQGEVVKIPGTGTYLFSGKPLELHQKIGKEIGDEVILTSGVRGILKQFLLFLSKASSCNGNLSLASRSLAPPGYSYHGIGDFDVGQAGLGAANFTEAFAFTHVCKRLRELGYLTLRYEQDNRLGVRFEPWHIKVIDA